MFLDDQLLKETKEADLTTEEGVQTLYNKLCRMCESYYKSKLNENTTNKVLKATLDRTFNLWDSFVNNLKKESVEYVLLADMLEENSFKVMMLKNPKVRQVYNSL